jgi:hypothetical protein
MSFLLLLLYKNVREKNNNNNNSKESIMTTINNAITMNHSFVRAYGENGKTITSKRGSAILLMLTFVKDGRSLMKSHKSYSRKNKNAVSYIRFVQLVRSFILIRDTKAGKNLIKILDTNPKATYESVLRVASALSEQVIANQELNEATESLLGRLR